MKKLLLIISIPLMFCCSGLLAQDLGAYYTSNANAKTNGLTFKIKKPLGYKQFQGEIETTIVGFSNNKIGGVISEFYISIYSLKEMELDDFKNMSKNEIKDIFLSNNMKYYELCGYPGWIVEESIVGATSLQSFTIIHGSLFVFKLTSLSKTIPHKEKELFYKMSNTLKFI